LIVVSDASPLIALAAVDRLDLLRALYTEVLTPEAVYQEATAVAPGASGAAEISAANWIRVRPVRDRTLVAALALQLDPGESEYSRAIMDVLLGLGANLDDPARQLSEAIQRMERTVEVLGVSALRGIL
jgi:predicted nucleic acid-binding protein